MTRGTGRVNNSSPGAELAEPTDAAIAAAKHGVLKQTFAV